jgi:ferredoxin
MENLYPPQFEELEAIEEFGLEENERLSCQAKLNGRGDVLIYIP